MSVLLTDPIFGHPGIRSRLDDAAVTAAMRDVEIALAGVQAELGLVPLGAAEAIRETLGSVVVDPAALREGVASAGVPVPALVEALRERLEPDAADWLHFGATSQDIVDTALCMCFAAALSGIETSLSDLIDGLEAQSGKYEDTLMVARTRGQLATPICFGLRVAQWAQPLIALEAETEHVRRSTLRLQLGGASGSGSVFGDRRADVASGLADALGLAKSAPWPTDRSGMRRLSNWLARLIAALGKIGRDIAISTRGEIAELSVAHVGKSSTMPHKSNPVGAEALQSLGAMSVACEAGLATSSVHAEERDGAMWSVEWAFLPMHFEAAGAALDHARQLVGGMRVDAAAMRARLDAVPAVYAEAAVFALSDHVGRVEASRIVKDALADGQPLTTLADRFPAIDWDAAFSDEAFVRPAAETARQVFSARQKPADGR